MAVGKIYRSYIRASKKNEVRHFDTIVIGSGMGGLSTASFLAQAGRRVLLLEQHRTIGGFTHSFVRGDYRWDVGLHYVGQVHVQGSLLNKVFRYITNNKLQWEPLDDIYDRAIFGSIEYEFPRGRKNFEKKLKGYFPNGADQQSIDKYFHLLGQVKSLGVGYYLEKTLPSLLAPLARFFLQKKTRAFSDKTTLEVLKNITDNSKLIGVLTAQYGDYGLAPGQSSFYMHALLVNHYMDGAAYPVGGGSAIAEKIVPIIEAANGMVLSGALVANVLVEKNKAIGVRMFDGEAFFADTIVSAAGIANTYAQLLPVKAIKDHALDKAVRKLSPSTAHVALYAGIKTSAAALGLPRCNYWVYPEFYDHDAARTHYQDVDAVLPVTFVSFPSAKDPEAQIKHPDRAVAEVVILLPYDWFKKWQGTALHDRGPDYESLKATLAAKMLEQLYRVAPQLKGRIDYYEVSTPLTTQYFSAHPSGEIYGVEHTPARFRQNLLRVHTPIKNFYLAGQDIMTASIAGSAMSGLLCASVILKKNLLRVIH